MYIKNLTGTDFELNINEAKIKLPANEIFYIDEEQISFEQIKNIYGKYVALVPDEAGAGVEKKYTDLKQTTLEAGSVYAVLAHMPGQAQVACMDGNAKIYVSDSTEKPAGKSDMKELIASLSGIEKIDILPKYILSDSADAIITNLVVKKLS